MLPQAYVYPAVMRATRDLLRRRMHLMRKRAELLTHVQQANSQYNLPEIGKKIAYKANREGVAERFDDPDVQKSIEVDLALIDYYDQLLTGVIVPLPFTYAANRLFCGTLADSSKTIGIGLDAKYRWWTSFQTPLNLITRKSKMTWPP